MKLVGAIAGILGFLAIGFAPGHARAAEKFDGSHRITCVPTLVSECQTDSPCHSGPAESENLARYFTVDLHAKRIEAPQTGRHSTITREMREKERLILSGAENQRVWVLIINRKTGEMSGSIVGDGETFAVFGVCVEP